MLVGIIRTERLDLWSMTPQFLDASLQSNVTPEVRFSVPGEWFAERALMEMRLNDLETKPSAQPWLLRAIVERDSQQMVGHIGFHTPPDPPYLQSICPGAVEFGYTVYSAYRRRGFAYEASLGMMDWAHQRHGIVDFIASADPDNIPSVNLLAKLGFEKIGGHMDEVDGYEDIFRRQCSRLTP